MSEHRRGAEAADLIGVQISSFGDAGGISPTEREFDRATETGKERLMFVVGADDAERHPKTVRLIQRAGEQLIRRRVATTAELTAAVYASLVDFLERRGDLRTLRFDAAAARDATLDDISEERVRWFLTQARQRQYSLADTTPPVDVLAHLNLLDGDRPTNAALLLFARQPQRFPISSEVKCLHFHGTEVRKPIPSYQVYKGTAFELVDQSVDFVMSKIARAVGTRAAGPQAPVDYELPRDAVAEAIVNAVAHRDYTSNASVQVMLFADRLEIWNPGELPPSLTPDRLTRPHASIPRNPLVAESLFLARYIERAGTGTLDMIARCTEAGLRKPQFRQDGGQFVQTLWRPAPVATTATPETAPPVTPPVAALLELLESSGELGNAEIREKLGLSDRTHVREHYIDPTLANGFIEPTVPDKPTSRLQKYRLTEQGRTWLAVRPKK